MNNEPVAWMDNYGNICLDIDKKMNQGKITARNNYDANDIPLYTHPAKTLTNDPLINFKPVWQEKPEFTLTDEEIHYAVKCWEMKYNYKHDADVHESLHEFAKTILKKASEK